MNRHTLRCFVTYKSHATCDMCQAMWHTTRERESERRVVWVHLLLHEFIRHIRKRKHCCTKQQSFLVQSEQHQTPNSTAFHSKHMVIVNSTQRIDHMVCSASLSFLCSLVFVVCSFADVTHLVTLVGSLVRLQLFCEHLYTHCDFNSAVCVACTHRCVVVVCAYVAIRSVCFR